VYLQLDNFNKRVWNIYSRQIKSFSKLDWYDVMILSTIVEKEERSKVNKSTVAGIFFNRIDN
jgi:cell division protein YceG involved in septum cleavage